MQYLAVGHYVTDPGLSERAAAGRVKEMRYAWTAYLDQTLRQAWCRAEGQAPILFMESISLDEARHRLDQSPFVHERLIDWELIDLTPFHPWSALFTQSSPNRD